MTKTFSVRSNAVRHARSQLGKAAQQGVHFTISGTKPNFTWSPVDGAPAVVESANENKVAETKIESLMSTEQPAKKTRKTKAKVTAAVKRYLGKRVKVADDVSGKRRILINMITGKNGASLAAICKRLDWQKHTVRGAISTAASAGLIKNVDSSKSPRVGRIYKATKVAA